MDDWYFMNVEDNVRELVYLLRNSGINTTSSCQHTMTIEAESYEDNEVTRISNLLFAQGIENFRITLTVDANKYCAKSLERHIRIELYEKELQST